MSRNWFPVVLSLVGFLFAHVVSTAEPGDKAYPFVEAALEFVDSAVVNEAHASPAEKKRRIVSLGGSLTEAIVAMGHAGHIVGVDTTSVYPPQVVKDYARVGYVRQLSAEGILSLEPGLIISSDHAGPKMAVEQIKKSGVAFEEFSNNYTVEGTQDVIRNIGKLLGEDKKAGEMVEAISTKIAEARKISEGFKKKPRVLFIYARGARMLNISGHTTSAHAMIELAGAENAFGDIKGFKPMTSEAVVAAAPDAILMLSRGVESVGGDNKILDLPGIALTPAGKNKNVIVMDDLKLLGFGPRLGDAVLELTQALQKQMDTPAQK